MNDDLTDHASDRPTGHAETISPGGSPIPAGARERLHAELDRAVRRRRVTRGAGVALAAVPLAGLALWAVAPSPPASPGGGAIAQDPEAPAPGNTPEVARSPELMPEPAPELVPELGADPSAQTAIADASASPVRVHRLGDAPPVAVARWTSASPMPVRLLSDEQLLDRLAQADRPSGLAEYRGEVHIIPLDQR